MSKELLPDPPAEIFVDTATKETPKRPTRQDDTIIKAVAQKLLPKVKEWLEEGDGCDMDDDEIIADLEKAIGWQDDGYEIAQKLDHAGWMPDAQLVDILDGTGHFKYQAWEQACKEWVKTHNIQAPELESRVNWTRKANMGVGTIVKNNDDGRSNVKFDSDSKESRTYIVEWEELVPA
jgi:hypothetical protein